MLRLLLRLMLTHENAGLCGPIVLGYVLLGGCALAGLAAYVT